jgi:hypothetical protein
MILVGTPSGDDIKALTASCRDVLQAPKGTMFIAANMIGTYVERNQNYIAEEAIKHNASHAMFIDSDMIFPADIVIKLHQRHKDIVGCVYRARSEPHQFVSLHLDGTPVDGTETGIREMLHIPSGMMLVKTEVFRRMGYPWFFNTYGVTPEEFVGNDINFCHKAQEKGFKVHADFYLSRTIAHIGGVQLKWQM